MALYHALDRCGIRIGGILSDVFGKNGRTIVEGLVSGSSRQQIVDRLTGHVRLKVGHLIDALGANLSETDRFLLQSLLRQHDYLNQQVCDIERLIFERLREHADQIQLLETIPGICRQSACDILIKIGGDVSAFDNAKAFSAWAGVSPGNNESAGKRRNARSVRGNPYRARC